MTSPNWPGGSTIQHSREITSTFRSRFQKPILRRGYASMSSTIRNGWTSSWKTSSEQELDGRPTTTNSTPNFGWTEIGFAIAPPERNRGCASEAAAILTDYLFLTRDIGRIQAVVDVENAFSMKALEGSGFKREGTLRNALWNRRGVWADGFIYGIVREEWKAPRVLTRDNDTGR